MGGDGGADADDGGTTVPRRSRPRWIPRESSLASRNQNSSTHLILDIWYLVFSCTRVASRRQPSTKHEARSTSRGRSTSTMSMQLSAQNSALLAVLAQTGGHDGGGGGDDDDGGTTLAQMAAAVSHAAASHDALHSSSLTFRNQNSIIFRFACARATHEARSKEPDSEPSGPSRAPP